MKKKTHKNPSKPIYLFFVFKEREREREREMSSPEDGVGDGGEPVQVTMAKIFSSIVFSCVVLGRFLTKTKRAKTTRNGSVLSSFQCETNPSKKASEKFIFVTSALWIVSIIIVIAFELYEQFTRWHYIMYCGSCAVPYILYPIWRPFEEDRGKPLLERYIVKANVWIAIFSFVGNYVWTHYFYSVLKAKYTFDAHRLNDVPISMFLMTHAYFMFYHAMTNSILRKIKTSYEKDVYRDVFYMVVVAALAYTTAFMETLTICAFPYWEFTNRNMAYTLGSAFYGIYFIVSFPMFLLVDEDVLSAKGKKNVYSMWRVVWESLGSCMLVTLLLDFVRVGMTDVDFTMKH